MAPEPHITLERKLCLAHNMAGSRAVPFGRLQLNLRERKLTQLGRLKPRIVPKIYLDIQPNQQQSGNSLMNQCHSPPAEVTVMGVIHLRPMNILMQLQVQGLLKDHI